MDKLGELLSHVVGESGVFRGVPRTAGEVRTATDAGPIGYGLLSRLERQSLRVVDAFLNGTCGPLRVRWDSPSTPEAIQ
jgi:hypothetical protein